jgi:hypothetical protein
VCCACLTTPALGASALCSALELRCTPFKALGSRSGRRWQLLDSVDSATWESSWRML